MLTTIKVWANSLAESFSRPRTYASELENYIVSKQPQNSADVDRIMIEFTRKNSGGFLC